MLRASEAMVRVWSVSFPLKPLTATLDLARDPGLRPHQATAKQEFRGKGPMATNYRAGEFILLETSWDRLGTDVGSLNALQRCCEWEPATQALLRERPLYPLVPLTDEKYRLKPKGHHTPQWFSRGNN